MFEIGTTLRETRARRRIDLVEAEQDTKIRSKYLAALESEDFDLLPGAVYTRGFLRTYAAYLGLDPQLYVDEYNERFGRFEDADDLAGPSALRAPQELRGRRSPFTLRRGAVVCLILLALLAWVGLRTEESGLREDDRVASAPARTAPKLGSNPTGEPASPLAAAAGTAAQRGDRRGDGAAAPAPPNLVVRAVGAETWMEVRAGGPTGTVRFSGTLANGAQRTFRGAKLWVSVGVSSAARLRSGDAAVRGTTAQPAAYLVTPGRIRSA